MSFYLFAETVHEYNRDYKTPIRKSTVYPSIIYGCLFHINISTSFLLVTEYQDIHTSKEMLDNISKHLLPQQATHFSGP